MCACFVAACFAAGAQARVFLSRTPPPSPTNRKRRPKPAAKKLPLHPLQKEKAPCTRGKKQHPQQTRARVVVHLFFLTCVRTDFTQSLPAMGSEHWLLESFAFTQCRNPEPCKQYLVSTLHAILKPPKNRKRQKPQGKARNPTSYP